MSFFTKAALAPVAASFALALVMASNAPASAQSSLTNGLNGMEPNSLGNSKPRRPLTVRRRAAAPEVVAAPAAPVVEPITGAASTVVALPFQVLGGIFPADGVRKGGVTSVRYVGTGAKQGEIDEGWTQAIPVDRSGPIYVVDNGDPTISPLVLVGEPIRAAGTLAQTPFKILAGVGL